MIDNSYRVTALKYRNYLLLHLALSHLQYIKHLILDLLQEQPVQTPFTQEQVDSTGFMSIMSSSCHRGTNEPPGALFHPQSVGSGITISCSASFHRYPAWIQALLTCCRISDGEGTNMRRLIFSVEISWSVLRDLNGACFDKLYASYTKLHKALKSCSVILRGQQLSFWCLIYCKCDKAKCKSK